jgi:hypothetical protein
MIKFQIKNFLALLGNSIFEYYKNDRTTKTSGIFTSYNKKK